MDDQGIIKLLIDRVSTRLDTLDGQLKGYQPVLDRIGSQSDDFIKLLGDTKKDIETISKILDNTAKDFYDRTDTIIKNTDSILNKLEDHDKNITKNTSIIKSVQISLDDPDKGVKSKAEKILSTLSVIEPVGKFFTFLSKPFGLIVFLIGMLLASMAITSTTKSIIDHFSNITIQKK